MQLDIVTIYPWYNARHVLQLLALCRAGHGLFANAIVLSD